MQDCGLVRCHGGTNFGVECMSITREVGEDPLSQCGQLQHGVAAVPLQLASCQNALRMQCGNGATHLGLVETSADTDFLSRHLAVATEMKQHAPLGSKHPVLPSVVPLELKAQGFGGLVEKVGQEILGIEFGIARHGIIPGLVSYIYNQ